MKPTEIAEAIWQHVQLIAESCEPETAPEEADYIRAYVALAAANVSLGLLGEALQQAVVDYIDGDAIF